jgi:hypothetical protein
MKKTLLTIALATAVASLSAQDMMSKKGTAILPETDDWCLGVSANSIIEYFGNLMNGNNSAPSFGFPNSSQVITGKMVKDDNTAYRANVRIGFLSDKVTALSDQTGSTSDPIATVEDSWKSSEMNVTLMAGLQKNRGNGRLRGIYGAEAGFMLGSSKHTFDYGNAITATATAPERTDFGFNDLGNDVWLTEDKDGSTFGLVIRGFIGAEYFFAPKMSLSGEFGWGLMMASTGEGEATAEFWDGTKVKTASMKTGKASAFGIDTDNAGGSINLNLYF